LAFNPIKAPTTALYESALIAKQTVSPNAAMSTPPIEGPMRRVPFISSELSATALGRSSRLSRSCTKIDWRVGISNALQTPEMNAMTASVGMVTRFSPETSASTSDTTDIIDRTVISSLRRFTRSPRTPASGVRKRCGALARNPMRPVNQVEPEIR
jgi:hypothetical protein